MSLAGNIASGYSSLLSSPYRVPILHGIRPDAPWSRENGGNGIAPTGARENWENDDFEDILRGGNEVEIELKNILSVGGAGGLLPSVESLKEPSNKEDAIKMLLLSEKMYRLGIEFFGNKINRVESETLGAVYKALTSTW